MALFRDRKEAGYLLAERLGGSVTGDAIVLAIPRGAVVIADEISRRFGFPLDLVIVRKVGHPDNPEFAAGAVDPSGDVLENPSAGVDREYLAEAARREVREIDRRMEQYRGDRPAPDVSGKKVVLVDDGVATGLTALSAVRYLKRIGAASVVLAVPVISEGASKLLEDEVDELVALETPTVFWAVGSFYVSFPQVSDSEVVDILSAR